MTGIRAYFKSVHTGSSHITHDLRSYFARQAVSVAGYSRHEARSFSDSRRTTISYRVLFSYILEAAFQHQLGFAKYLSYGLNSSQDGTTQCHINSFLSAKRNRSKYIPLFKGNLLSNRSMTARPPRLPHLTFLPSRPRGFQHALSGAR